MPLYFAYGSNLALERMRERVGRFGVRGVARLDGHRLAFNKLGRDGSGKANLVADPEGRVWGVVYELDAALWARLDRYEGGYARVEVEVEVEVAVEVDVERVGAAALRAQTYVSARLCAEPPYAWYVEHVLRGARQHGLPDAYVRWLASLPARPPDAETGR